jgi:hypothetical protein
LIFDFSEEGLMGKARGLQSRAEFLFELGDGEAVRPIIAKLQQIAVGGDLSAIKYVLDQLYGTAKTSMVTEIDNREMFARIVRVTASHLRGQEFDAWLSQVRIELGGESFESTT